jgi:hypothetical protein
MRVPFIVYGIIDSKVAVIFRFFSSGGREIITRNTCPTNKRSEKTHYVQTERPMDLSMKKLEEAA